MAHGLECLQELHIGATANSLLLEAKLSSLEGLGALYVRAGQHFAFVVRVPESCQGAPPPSPPPSAAAPRSFRSRGPGEAAWIVLRGGDHEEVTPEGSRDVQTRKPEFVFVREPSAAAAAAVEVDLRGLGAALREEDDIWEWLDLLGDAVASDQSVIANDAVDLSVSRGRGYATQTPEAERCDVYFDRVGALLLPQPPATPAAPESLQGLTASSPEPKKCKRAGWWPPYRATSPAAGSGTTADSLRLAFTGLTRDCTYGLEVLACVHSGAQPAKPSVSSVPLTASGASSRYAWRGPKQVAFNPTSAHCNLQTPLGGAAEEGRQAESQNATMRAFAAALSARASGCPSRTGDSAADVECGAQGSPSWQWWHAHFTANTDASVSVVPQFMRFPARADVLAQILPQCGLLGLTWRGFVGADQLAALATSNFLQLVEPGLAPGRWLWLGAPMRGAEARAVYLAACYTLPTFLPRPLLSVINPEMRYCIDLLGNLDLGGGPTRARRFRSPHYYPVRWDRSKQVRRHLEDFRLSVNRDFEGSLRRLRRYHTNFEEGPDAPEPKGTGEDGEFEGTWLTDELLAVMCRMEKEERERAAARKQQDFGEGGALEPLVRHYVFELWEGEELCAVAAGFGVGCAYHDYSMATLRRDGRSCGTTLTKTVGDLLRKCGYTMWYWGCKIGYMEQYDRYGGREIPRKEFKERWAHASVRAPRLEIEEALYEQEIALVKPLHPEA